ncbi:MAG: hypothetical protein M3405_03695 [Acidobacteriota bacterium]|jgi:hypothetical protein|nr:hypothetical protein [Acidobacteriota bacterium]
MTTKTLPAHFNGEKIVLDEPFDLTPNMKIVVTVISEKNSDSEDWILSAKKSLARAYSDNEPEYGLESI